MTSLIELLGDRRDERRARQLRNRFGRQRRLLSWQRLGPERWLARLSGPEHPETIEALGSTRLEAIAAAELVLGDARVATHLFPRFE